MLREYLYLLATDKKAGFFAVIFKAFLLILSFIYGLAIIILSFIFRIRPYRLNSKVVSIGNITLGGTGKTSLVELLAKLLRNEGHRVAVLSRGYKRQAKSSKLPAPSYASMGDEPYMLSRNLGDIPIIVDEDRIRAAVRAIDEYRVDTVILDDGFQQWRIKKDLEIVTVAATNPLGNLRLIPRGILREPLSSLRRADIFVLTKINLNPDNQRIKQLLKKINPHALIIEAIYKPIGFYKQGKPKEALINLDELEGRRVSLVSGIADPESFEELIRHSGIKVGLAYRFPDHHIYKADDLDKIINESKEKEIDVIITTEKDSVRFPAVDCGLWTMDCFVLRIELEMVQYELFLKRIHSLY